MSVEDDKGLAKRRVQEGTLIVEPDDPLDIGAIDFDEVLGDPHTTDDARLKTLIARRIQQGTLLREQARRRVQEARESGKRREHALGFGSIDVPPDTQVIVSVETSIPIAPHRLLIPSKIAPDFSIVDIKVGKNSQLAVPNDLPAVLFSEVSTPLNLKLDTARPGIHISLQVRNVSNRTSRFTAAIIAYDLSEID